MKLPFVDTIELTCDQMIIVKTSRFPSVMEKSTEIYFRCIDDNFKNKMCKESIIRTQSPHVFLGEEYRSENRHISIQSHYSSVDDQ